MRRFIGIAALVGFTLVGPGRIARAQISSGPAPTRDDALWNMNVSSPAEDRNRSSTTGSAATVPATSRAGDASSPPTASPRSSVRDGRPAASRASENAAKTGTSVEWYRATAEDARLPASPRSPWQGTYNGNDLQWRFHHFFSGPLQGLGAELNLRIDAGRNFGGHVGVYFPGNLIVLGFHFWGGRGIPVADIAAFDMQLGVLLPQFNLNVVTNFDSTVILHAGLDLVGLRAILLDIIRVDLRFGAPEVWFSIPQFGLGWSWTGSLDVGVYF